MSSYGLQIHSQAVQFPVRSELKKEVPENEGTIPESKRQQLALTNFRRL
jgi:hypothetical protein